MSVELSYEQALMQKTDEIVAQIQRSESARRFWQAREKMERNVEAQALFEELKRKTNNYLVASEQLQSNHPKLASATKDVQTVEQRLAEIPVAFQYTEAQEELNGLVQEVVQVLLTRLSAALPVELGPKQGCGKGHDGNGCSCGNQ